MRPDPNDLACQELVELVTEYMEGAIASEDRARFEEHLLACVDCTAYVQQMRQTARLAGALAGRGVARETADALLAAFRRRGT